LVDYASFAKAKGIHISHFTSHAVTLSDVLSVAKEQGTEFRTGDILLLRTGYVEAYKDLDVDQKNGLASVKEWCGLGQSRETTEWLWQRQFAAVVSDSPGFEVRRKFSSCLDPDKV
jgi:kynurenine formamidase